jgi:hypothetical protein
LNTIDDWMIGFQINGGEFPFHVKKPKKKKKMADVISKLFQNEHAVKNEQACQQK